MPVRCRSSEEDFNVVVAAALLDGRSTSLGGGHDTLLTAVFQSRPTDRGSADDNDENISSALCVYRMSQVRDTFTRNVRRCFAGEQKYVGLQFGNRICVSLVSTHCSAHMFRPSSRLSYTRIFIGLYTWLCSSVLQENSAKLANQRVSCAFTFSPFSFHVRHILPTSKFQNSYSCILLIF